MLPVRNVRNFITLRNSWLLLRNAGKRSSYSTKPKAPRKDELPSFTKIALVGVVGTIIFAEAVKSLDKNQPKNSYSESEYAEVVKNMKRRKVMFPPGELKVQIAVQGVSPGNFHGHDKIVDPFEVVETYRKIENDKYQPLLNDLKNTYGDQYIKNLPQGLLVMLIGRYLKDNCQKGDNVLVVDFPLDMNDAIKFENEISVVDKVLFSSSEADTNLAKYYQTVNKVEVV
ncbi:LAQU0S04e07140g1_1 [Lachancea quebecensis]|uniref:LAQU0S04e07140g1_1 n=1 Tax=Lachancea quebecensis TaxID=1654605 RepID=A0A0P1KQT3_9SACH|nr:LAQU0S04e07140g1_1 [Lachancea quebecensis]